ncbi:MAG TPA: membrane protein insertase YidC, partial [Thermoanaerobaculia bacterium]
MDNRRLFLAILLSLAVLMLWFYLFPAPPALPGKGGPETAAPSIPAGSPAPATPPLAAKPAAPESAKPSAPREDIAAAVEERVVLESSGATAVFTNRGAQLTSLQLKGSKTTGGTPLELVRARQERLYPYGLTAGGLKPHPLNGALFRVEKGGDGRSATFRYSGPLGVAEKTFRFDARGLLEFEVGVEQPGWGLMFGPGIRNPTEAELKNRFEHRGVVYREGESVETLDPQKEESVKVLPRSVRWVGIDDLYFLSAVIPEEGVGRVMALPVLVRPGEGGETFQPLPPKDQLTKEQGDLSRELAVVLEP